MSVTLEEIAAQRALGWPDFHPEDYCHRCGRSNIVWFTQSEFWNAAVPVTTEILCPQCFVVAYEAATGESPAWELLPDALTTPWGVKCIQNAEVEVERLRSALREIVQWNEDRNQPGAWAAHVARSALEPA